MEKQNSSSITVLHVPLGQLAIHVKQAPRKQREEENIYSPHLCKCHELPYHLHSATPTGSARLHLPVLRSGSASSHGANAVTGLILFSFSLGSWSNDDCCPMSKNHGFMLFSFLLFLTSGNLSSTWYFMGSGLHPQFSCLLSMLGYLSCYSFGLSKLRIYTLPLHTVF